MTAARTVPARTGPGRAAAPAPLALPPQPEKGRPRPELRVVRSEKREQVLRRRRRTVLVALALSALAALIVFGIVAAHVVLAQNQFALTGLEADSRNKQAEYERLRLEMSELESPSRIIVAAQQRLGMVSPSNVTYLSPSLPGGPNTAAATAGTPANANANDGRTSAQPPPTSGYLTTKSHLAER